MKQANSCRMHSIIYIRYLNESLSYIHEKQIYYDSLTRSNASKEDIKVPIRSVSISQIPSRPQRNWRWKNPMQLQISLSISTYTSLAATRQSQFSIPGVFGLAWALELL